MQELGDMARELPSSLTHIISGMQLQTGWSMSSLPVASSTSFLSFSLVLYVTLFVVQKGLLSWNYSARRKAAMRELGDMPTALPLGACAASSAAIAGPLPSLPCLERPSRPGSCTARIFLCACCCPSSCAHNIYCHTMPASFTRCISS